MPEPTTKPPSHRDDALAVLMRLRDAGQVAYFAGGCVRDLLLGLAPKDFDVATDAPPDVVRRLFPNTQAVGAAFGVILIRQRKSTIEVATFRTDGEYSDGRRPDSVRFTTAEEDAQRRDFTINGLFLDPIDNRIIDYVGGQADLQAKLIRAIGDPAKRFEEDYLRMLRAVRFAARFEFHIEPVTVAAITKAAPNLPRISPERIADELRRMLTPFTRDHAWRMLDAFGLKNQIFRQFGKTGGNLFFLACGPCETISFGLALAAGTLSYVYEPDHVEKWLERPAVNELVRVMRTTLKISNEESEMMREILCDAGTLLKKTTLADRMRIMAHPTAPETRWLLRAIGTLGKYAPRIIEIEDSLVLLESVDCAPSPLVTGDDLTAAGLSPGPVFKRVLDAVYDAQLELRVSDRSAAMAMAMELAAQK